LRADRAFPGNDLGPVLKRVSAVGFDLALGSPAARFAPSDASSEWSAFGVFQPIDGAA
jgi:hypothetical protein